MCGEYQYYYLRKQVTGWTFVRGVKCTADDRSGPPELRDAYMKYVNDFWENQIVSSWSTSV